MKNLQKIKERANKIWYHFYYEPYFKKNQLKDYPLIEKGDIAKDINKQQLQAAHIPILLPLLLSHKNFYESYLNVSLPHRRHFSNSQHLLTQSLMHLLALSYPQDSFYCHFATLAHIDKSINKLSQNDEILAQLEALKDIHFEKWEDTQELSQNKEYSKMLKNLAPTKALLESKYKALWCNTFIRYERYINKDEEPARYEEIYKHIKEGINALERVQKWDYDCAMLFLSLIGYTFLGTQGNGCAFMKLDEKLRERYIDAYKNYISPLKGTKNNDSKTCQIDIDECKDKLQAHLSHPHIALYLDYYEFLYLQMQFEHIAAKNKTKNFQEFKEHLYEAQSHIDSLLTKYSAYHYFIMKFLKHRVRIYEIIWHIELKSLEFQVQSPFDFELKDSKNSILKESDTIAKYIDSFFGSKE